MGTPLRVLIVEDLEDDALLLVRDLQRGGYEPIFERVDTPEAMSAALAQQTWDVVIADYSMPHFSGLVALRLLQESGLDLPFIVVSGTIGEEVAVAAMKAGAHDYIMKDNLARLVPAIERELREAKVRLERKQAEEALHDSEERYRALYEDNPSMYFTVDAEGTVLSVNRFGAEQLGYTVEELVGQPVLNVFYEDDKEAVRQQLTACLQNFMQVAHWEFRKVRKDGSMLWVKEAARAVRGTDGNPVVLIVCEDITERKRAEEQLRQAQKMEAIGTLAGGIAHDFNNILTGILGFASVVHAELPADSLLRSDVETIIHSAQRASELTRQLLTLARRSKVEVHPLSLNDTAREVIRLLEHTIDKAIAIEPYLAKDLATVDGDAGQLHQMLLNLCLNARDAMPQGGRLIIETRNVTLSEREAHTGLDLEAGRYVLLSVTDTGTGMDAGTRRRIFEPFFTTKEQGRGLGLAMAYGIVRGHGGAIHVYSEPGQGSTFKVYLPGASLPAEDTAPEEIEVVGGSETVLVVDDEGSVRALLRRILEEGGYTVLLATDGVEAMELYAERSAEIDLVVLDIIMPKMGGRGTYERLREINPEVKVLLSSGYSENGRAQDILAVGAQGFLQKPYDQQAVLRKAREVLEG